jgi:hypothetical protein
MITSHIFDVRHPSRAKHIVSEKLKLEKASRKKKIEKKRVMATYQ